MNTFVKWSKLRKWDFNLLSFTKWWKWWYIVKNRSATVGINCTNSWNGSQYLFYSLHSVSYLSSASSIRSPRVWFKRKRYNINLQFFPLEKLNIKSKIYNQIPTFLPYSAIRSFTVGRILKSTSPNLFASDVTPKNYGCYPMNCTCF